MIEVRAETPLQAEVAALLRQSDAVAAALYPGAWRRPIDPASLAQAEATLFVARLDGRAIGCCVLFDRGDGTGEIKRMIVTEAARGSGVGKALLAAAEDEAAARGMTALLLEVGTRNEAAHAMYLRAGFLPRGPFAPYAPSPISRFLAKPLNPPTPRSAG